MGVVKELVAVAALEELRFGLVERIVADIHSVVEEEQAAVDRRLQRYSGNAARIEVDIRFGVLVEVLVVVFGD